MNGSTKDREDRFDAAMQQRHAAAIGHVSAHAKAKLQPRRHAVPATTPGRSPAFSRVGWPVLASFAAVLAVVIGLQVRDASKPATVAVAPVEAGTIDNLDTVLDENPDFYLWLASRDAAAIAME
ncbi:MAG: hypothetical protein ACOH1R_07110 [Luteimonas sp.]